MPVLIVDQCFIYKYKKFCILLTIFFGVLTTPLWGQQAQLSSETKVSLITASPGNELYTIFGHTALRLVDPVSNIDHTYNYGTFDFDTNGFYRKFTLGNLQYFLSVNKFENAKKAYLNDGRIITEQRLNLTENQTKRLYDFLENNARPENRYYSYEFFYDNCTTRVYEALKAVAGDSIHFQEPQNSAKNSFRQFINPYLESVSWVKFGINLLLGTPADRNPSESETLFLPDLLKEGFSHARIQQADTSLALVSEQRFYAPQKRSVISPASVSPTLTFWFLLITSLLAGFFYRTNQTFWFWFDRLLFGIIGLIGVLIFTLWLLSSYPSTKWNWNIVWSAPALPAFIFSFTGRKRLSENYKVFLVLYAAILLLFLLSWSFIPQQIPSAILPLLFLLGFRSIKKQSESVNQERVNVL
ncbi:MAG: DUF4105 domain-containing protein [Gracilimonas sp.]|uniref:lipoprotein N-acyltransferase Lnb domain-containing protein n=1 Tax=Gracilimonas sp. TaxID=1974203 RepID=UPI003751FD36|nr:DUF4105 domain-containing protein [Gracilimonas sp.]